MFTVEQDGWEIVRGAVLQRDGGCVAVQPELTAHPATDLCADQWNTPHPFTMFRWLQLDHVNEFGTLQRKAPDDEAHLQSVCAHHHRTWAPRKENRADSRARLSRLYPEAWAAWLAR